MLESITTNQRSIALLLTEYVNRAVISKKEELRVVELRMEFHGTLATLALQQQQRATNIKSPPVCVVPIMVEAHP